jgi:hypothetical protein
MLDRPEFFLRHEVGSDTALTLPYYYMQYSGYVLPRKYT